MSEEWTELVWTSVSLIIAAVVISLGFTFANLGTSLSNQLYEDQAQVNKLQEIRLMVPYDETELSGSEVLAAVQELSGKGIPTLVIVNNYSASTATPRAFMMYSDTSDIKDVWATLRKASNSQISSNWIETAAGPQNQDGNNIKLISRVSNKQYTTAALVSLADSMCSNPNTFSECVFKSHTIEENGTLLGVVFNRIKLNDNSHVEVI